MYYFDAPGELCTLSILNELDVQMIPFASLQTGKDFAHLDIEHMESVHSKVVLYVAEGSVNVDIRDDGDCWIVRVVKRSRCAHGAC